jgi:hypothetical protein
LVERVESEACQNDVVSEYGLTDIDGHNCSGRPNTHRANLNAAREDKLILEICRVTV